ncbi:MAG: hypothetical protein FWD47_14115, partial [Treponema sp.]|nr:hypothetical protein [Treponema sp.]
MKLNCEDADKTNSQIKLIYCFAAFTFFTCGVLIYVLFRNTDNLIIFKYILRPSFMDSLPIPVRTDTLLSYLLIFNLPHGLWCLSGLLVIRAIFLTDIKWRAIYAGIFLVIISALEISQLNENRNGTFDVLDLASY